MFQEVVPDDTLANGGDEDVLAVAEEVTSSPDGVDGVPEVDTLTSQRKHRLRRKSDPALPASVPEDAMDGENHDGGDGAVEDIQTILF